MNCKWEDSLRFKYHNECMMISHTIIMQFHMVIIRPSRGYIGAMGDTGADYVHVIEQAILSLVEHDQMD